MPPEPRGLDHPQLPACCVDGTLTMYPGDCNGVSSGGVDSNGNLTATGGCQAITNRPPGRWCCMNTRPSAWFGLLATGLLAFACGSVPTTTAKVASPTAAATSPNPTPTAASNPCPPPSNRCLAVVALRGINPWVLRDITSISHAKTVSTFMTSPPQFVSGTELSYADDTGVFRMPLSGSPTTHVSKPGQPVSLFSWSPSGTTLAYLAQSGSGMALHLLSAGQDRAVVGSIPAVPVTGCESQFCGGTWDLRLSYSPDGAFISLVESIANVNAFRLWSSGGKLLIRADSSSRSMSTWSGHSFYFPGATGVDLWRGGVTSSFLPGVTWIRPNASPAGGQIVYETRDAQGWAHTFVVDTTTRKIRELKKARTSPVFLTSRYVWYKGQRACVTTDYCPSGRTVADSGKTYIYDLLDSTETESVITAVFDVWPHAA